MHALCSRSTALNRPHRLAQGTKNGSNRQRVLPFDDCTNPRFLCIRRFPTRVSDCLAVRQSPAGKRKKRRQSSDGFPVDLPSASYSSQSAYGNAVLLRFRGGVAGQSCEASGLGVADRQTHAGCGTSSNDLLPALFASRPSMLVPTTARVRLSIDQRK